MVLLIAPYSCSAIARSNNPLMLVYTKSLVRIPRLSLLLGKGSDGAEEATPCFPRTFPLLLSYAGLLYALNFFLVLLCRLAAV